MLKSAHLFKFKMCKKKEEKMAKEVNLIIDGNKVTVPEGTTILNAARSARSRYSNIVFFERYK